MLDPTDYETYRALLAEQGIREETLVTDDDGTLCGQSRGAEASQEVAALPVLLGDRSSSQLELTGELGKGGMGTIHLARQTALDRDVAVKQAIFSAEDRHEAADALLSEARVTGKLEHPNIVPVHDLGVNDEGDVLLVMKRIEGTPWSKLLKARGSPQEDLERHIRILMDVCEAIAFAHDKGVLHRDLKPTNVMVGSFGEVYVLDWGLAVGISSRAPAGTPKSEEATDVVGTPAYMAPEMAMPGSVIDERTDGYLLGAVLHKIITGKAPHKKADIIAGLHDAFVSSKLTFSDDVPEELAGVCRRAMERDPEDRYASVREFRAALVLFLQHKSARDLSAEASERLNALLQTIGGTDVDEHALQRTFAEARFGFEQALRVWPESTIAAEGRERALSAMVGHELDNGRVDFAVPLLNAMEAPPVELQERLAALQKKRETETSALHSLREAARELDTNIGSRARGMVIAFIGVGWCALQLITGQLQRAGLFEPSIDELVVAQLGVLVSLTAIVLWKRTSLLKNRASRSFIAALFVTVIGCLMLWIFSHFKPLDVPTALGLCHIIMWVAVAATVPHERRIWSAAVILPIGIVIPWFPALALEINGFVLLFALLGMAWALRNEAPEDLVEA